MIAMQYFAMICIAFENLTLCPNLLIAPNAIPTLLVKTFLMLLIYILGTPLDEIVFPDQSHTQYLGQTIPHIRSTNKQLTLIQCCFNAGPTFLKCPISDKLCSLAVGDHVIKLCLEGHLNTKAKRQYPLTLEVSK